MKDLLNNNFFSSTEPQRSCLLFLRDFILGYSNNVSEKWSNNTPFYYLKKKSLCFISYDPKTKIIYISFTKGFLITHKALVSEGRKKARIIYVDPEKDIDLKTLKQVFDMACSLLD